MKPTFIRGKGSVGQIQTYGLAEHYRRIFRGLTKWGGLPEGCPSNFPQDAIFFSGGVGAKDLRGIGTVLAGVKPSTLTVYATPYSWIPEPIGMAMDLSSDFFQPSTDPCCWLGESIANLIEPYLQIMDRTMKVLNQNLIALSQPVMVKGVPGSELPALQFRNELMDAQMIIPATGAGFSGAEVLDLKAQDHTQNYISTIDWCDARILEVMMSSNGVEKASGITTLETVSGVQSIIQEYEEMLERCRAFCDEANDRFGLSMTVAPGRGIETLIAKKPETATNDNDRSKDATNGDDADEE